MSLIGRIFVVFFAFLAACLVAGMIVVGAVLYPEFSDLGSGTIDQDAINVVLGFGFIRYTWRLWRHYSDALARRTFRFSIWHLSLLFAALLLDHYLGPLL